MRDAMTSRGPDDAGMEIRNGTGLGHRRLSILDLSPAGHQPMCNEDRSVWVVFNGEIYNFAELRRELEGLGHRFVSNSDTEVIVHGWEAWGERCVERLRGMFAFAVWDDRRRVLFLARDRVGIKPLFYYWDGRTLAFASELKALRQCPDLDLAVDPTALFDFLTYLYIPAPKTAYKNVRKLEPGHRLLFDGRRLHAERYWDWNFAPRPITERKAVEELRALLAETVRLHLVSDVPLGVLLSGGVDSSAVAAFAGPVMTFSIGFDVAEHSETAFARAVAGRFGTRHVESTVALAEGKRLLDWMVEWYDEPYYDTSAIPTYLVCREARRHVTVALSGDGGDEVFGGYTHYTRFRRLMAWDVLPKALRRLVPGRSGERLRLDPLERYAFLMGGMVEHEKARVPGLAKFKDYDALWSFRRFWREDLDVPTRLQYLDAKTYLPDDILTKVDRASMAVSLEVRPPLLDHRLMEFVATLPTHVRLKGGRLKYLLKKALEGLLPEEILTRKKKGFSVPLRTWLAGGLLDEPGLAGLRYPHRVALWQLDRWCRLRLGAGWQEVLRP